MLSTSRPHYMSATLYTGEFRASLSVFLSELAISFEDMLCLAARCPLSIRQAEVHLPPVDISLAPLPQTDLIDIWEMPCLSTFRSGAGLGSHSPTVPLSLLPKCSPPTWAGAGAKMSPLALEKRGTSMVAGSCTQPKPTCLHGKPMGEYGDSG